MDRLQQQIAFMIELDKLKGILRRTKPVGMARYENSAEHSWHLAMMAILLAEYADEPVDVGRVIQIVLVHDIVEIDADDTFVYDEEARRNKQAIEAAAAERIFGLLPADQRDQLMALWQEYETRTTPEGRFAYALDRLLPLTQNYHNGGQTWQENGIRAEQVRRVNAPIGLGSQRLWSQAQAFIDDAVRQGFLPDTVSSEAKLE